MVTSKIIPRSRMGSWTSILAGLVAAAAAGLQISPVYPYDHEAVVPDTSVSYATLNKLSRDLSPLLQDVTQATDFFAYYRLNLYEQKCPVRTWDESGTCGNIACKVDTLEDERDIPQSWRAEELSKLEGPKAAHPDKKAQQDRQRPLQGDLGEDVGESCVVEYDDECDERDYCIQEDESASAKGDYVSLVDNPERFTGYAGESVWEAIYRENCFAKNSDVSDAASAAASDLRYIFQAKAKPQELILDDECLEKRVFHRIISGMHASITTHICYDYLNQTTGIWGPNLPCYRDRLLAFPERISNLYLDYAILVRAVAKLQSSLSSYTFCTGDTAENLATKAKVLALTDAVVQSPPIFDEKTMFRDPELSHSLKGEFRNRFRNVSRLMDCVGCDKCRLWGKLQTLGYGTALKVLFEFDDAAYEKPQLRRIELVALINTLDRVSNSLLALDHLQSLDYEDALSSVYKEHAPNEPADVKDDAHVDDEDAHVDDEDAHVDDEDEPQIPPLPFKDVLRNEIRLVLSLWVYVLQKWFFLPAKLFRIVVIELSRLWSFWLGLPMEPRSWQWEYSMPTHEEL